MGRIQSIDYRILALIQRRLRCTALDRAMPVISATSNAGWLWITLSFLFVCFDGYRACGLTMMGALLTCAVLCNLVLKPIVGRYRPCHNVSSLPLLVRRPVDYSFPSGHTISAFAAATVIFHFHYGLGVAALVLASLVAFSRIYLFVHYPTDVLAGVVLGLTIAWGAVAVNLLILTRAFSS